MYQDQITELLHLHAGRGRKLWLSAFDDDVREVEEVDFERVQYTLPSDDDLLRLFFDWE